MENIGLPKYIKPRPYWVQYLCAYIVFFLGIFVGKIRVQGRWNIPKEGPIVLASNHFAYFDPFLLVYAIHRPIYFIMQKELGIEPQFLFAPMIYGAILTDRNKVGPSIVKQSLNTIKNGKILGIFPEGGITSPVLTKAKPGAVYLASIAKATVLPVSVRGASDAWDNIFSPPIIMFRWLLWHLHKRGVRTAAWVLNHSHEFRVADQFGFYGIMTDYPQRFLQYELERKKIR